MPGPQITLVCFLFLLEFISGQRSRFNPFNNFNQRQNSIEDQVCRRGFRCIAENWCRPWALRRIEGRPQQCGYTNDWKTRICCPERMNRVAPVPDDFLVLPNAPPTQRVRWGPNVPPTRGGKYIPDQTGPSNPDTECGRHIDTPSRRAYVIGGKDAKQGTWPWMVAITRKNIIGSIQTICSGFLIDRQHVLSAAHCFERERNWYSVRVGHVDIKKSKKYSIKRIKMHPGFVNGSFYDDIALLTLNRPVQEHVYNRICLPCSREFIDLTGKGTSIAGWGVTSRGGATSRIMQELNAIPVVPNNKCNQIFSMRLWSYKKDFPRGVIPSLICAGFTDESEKDSCQGDSGGPLMFEYRGQWYAVGVVAFGFSCGRPGVPGGYTKVSEYLNWINDNRNDV